MSEKGRRPGLVSYNTLIDGLCKHCKINKAQQIFHEMPKHGLNPDVVTYNTLISGFCKVGNLGKAKELLREI